MIINQLLKLKIYYNFNFDAFLHYYFQIINHHSYKIRKFDTETKSLETTDLF